MMARRVGFTLDTKQIEMACVAWVAGRLLPDEEAKAAIKAVNGAVTGVDVTCDISVSKKRVRKPRTNGAQE
jgi:hypothetical protein